MKKIILALFIFASIITKAQSVKEKIADKRFNNLEFASASEMYEELSNSKRPKTKFYVRAGESNFMVGNYKKAQLYYDKAFTNTGMTDYDLYNYYQVLKYNSNYIAGEPTGHSCLPGLARASRYRCRGGGYDHPFKNTRF